jgi:hypothetical protein
MELPEIQGYHDCDISDNDPDGPSVIALNCHFSHTGLYHALDRWVPNYRSSIKRLIEELRRPTDLMFNLALG